MGTSLRKHFNLAVGDLDLLEESSSEEASPERDTPHPLGRRMLSYLLTRKLGEIKQLRKLVQSLTSQRLYERGRAEAAERRSIELASSLRETLDTLESEQHSGAVLREELNLYKTQLNAQQEITREAQKVIDNLVAERSRLEEDASRARSSARLLKEKEAVREAYDQGIQEGMHSMLQYGPLAPRRREQRKETDEGKTQQHQTERPLASRSSPLAQGSQAKPMRENGSRSSTSSEESVGRLRRTRPRLQDVLFSSNEVTPTKQARRPTNDFISLLMASKKPPGQQAGTSKPTLSVDVSPPRSSLSQAQENAEHPPMLPLFRPNISDFGVAQSFERTPRKSSGHVYSDGWIPHAQDAYSNGTLSIHLPPPHELSDNAQHHDRYDIVESPKDGTPIVIPAPVLNSRSPSPPLPPLPPSPPRAPPRFPKPKYSAVPPPPMIHDPSQRHDVPAVVHISNEDLPPRMTNQSQPSTLTTEYELLASLKPSGSSHRSSSSGTDSESQASTTSSGSSSNTPRGRAMKEPIYNSAGMRVKAVLDNEQTQHRRPQIYANLPPPPPPIQTRSDERPEHPRAQSSGAIPIHVEPPSPTDTPPLDSEIGISHPHLLSPEYKPDNLPTAGEIASSEGEACILNSSVQNESNREHHHYFHKQLYEQAPVSQGVRYPPSPLAKGYASQSTTSSSSRSQAAQHGQKMRYIYADPASRIYY